MRKGQDAYRSIGETARLIGVATHVLRYWETQFPQLNPIRRPDGRRYYRPDDVRLAAALAKILHDEGMTTRGAARLIQRDGIAAIRALGTERLTARPEPPQSREPKRSVEPAPLSANDQTPSADTEPSRQEYLGRLVILAHHLRVKPPLPASAKIKIIATSIKSRMQEHD